MARRIVYGSGDDMSITQKTRAILLESGNLDVVLETILTSIGKVEARHNREIRELQNRCTALELERTEFLKETGVLRIIDAKIGNTSADWLKWGARKILPYAFGLGACAYALWSKH